MKKKIIVYTSGTFEFMHIGHINLLRRAKELGDYLIVGVSTDALANSYRTNKIIIPFEQRIEMVKSCKYVDKVVKQTSLVELAEMKKINPDIYAVGDDWKDKKLAGIEWLKKQPGKKVVYLPRTPKVSSTDLRQKITVRSVEKKLEKDLRSLEDEALKLGISKVIPINTKDLVFDPKCIIQCFHCKNFNIKHTCPGKIPKIDYKELITNYEKGLILIYTSKFDKETFANVRRDSTNNLHNILLKLEEISFKLGYHFRLSFIGGSCKICSDCPVDKCRFPSKARIPVEGAGIDIIKTLKQFDIELSFPLEDKLNRVGLLLVK